MRRGTMSILWTIATGVMLVVVVVVTFMFGAAIGQMVYEWYRAGQRRQRVLTPEETWTEASSEATMDPETFVAAQSEGFSVSPEDRSRFEENAERDIAVWTVKPTDSK